MLSFGGIGILKAFQRFYWGFPDASAGGILEAFLRLLRGSPEAFQRYSWDGKEAF